MRAVTVAISSGSDSIMRVQLDCPYLRSQCAASLGGCRSVFLLRLLPLLLLLLLVLVLALAPS